jgi:hypothetical protein
VIPRPPDGLAELGLHRLRAGARLHRIHGVRQTGAQPNPCLGRPSRFAPLWSDGACVPTLHAASDLAAAAFETVFHDVPSGPGRRMVFRDDLLDQACSVLELTADLALVPLFAPELDGLGVRRQDLIETPPTGYAETVLWAEAVWRRCPEAQGMVWTARRGDPGTAYLLFAPRLPPHALRVVARREVRTDLDLVQELIAIGARARIDIV